MERMPERWTVEIGVSFVTVQNILNKHALGSRYERLLALEKKALDNQITLTAEQTKPSSRLIPALLNVMSRAADQGNYSARTPSMSANSKAWAKCTCTQS